MVQHVSFEKLVGTVLGKYRLDKLLEAHKWGPVFLATAQDGTSFLLRFIGSPMQGGSDELSPDARLVFLGRFQQEANQVAALQHPHILPLLDYGNHHGTPYLVSPALVVSSLRSLLTRSVPDKLSVVDRYLNQISSALEYAHQAAVLHRNLSTSNIFLYQEKMVVAEFGLQRMHELSVAGSARPSFDGSSESCAPEQLLGKQVDVHTDVYALGAVLYRMLTGRAPFTGKTFQEIAQQHIYAEVPPPTSRHANLPPALDRVVLRAMAKEPFQRYSHPLELAREFHSIVAPSQPFTPIALPATATPDPRPTPLRSDARPAQAPASTSRRNFLVAASSAGVVAVAAGSLLYLRSRSATPQTTSTGSPAATATSAPANNAPTTQPAATQPPQNNAAVLARTSDLPANSAKTFAIDGQQNPGVLIHLPDNNFVAFDTTCTHAGCSVSYDQASHLLKCPCHGAVFDPAKNAAVVQPPAQTPLTSIKIVVNNDGTITKA